MGGKEGKRDPVVVLRPRTVQPRHKKKKTQKKKNVGRKGPDAYGEKKKNLSSLTEKNRIKERTFGEKRGFGGGDRSAALLKNLTSFSKKGPQRQEGKITRGREMKKQGGAKFSLFCLLRGN